MRLALDDIVLSQPFDTLVGIIFLGAIICLSIISSKKIKINQEPLINLLINYFVIIIILSHIFFFIALVGFEIFKLRLFVLCAFLITIS